jgi:RNA polymerase sigma-70 factor, ECF subfamily
MSPDSADNRSEQKLDLSEHLDSLYGYAMALCRNRAEAEDLVQETCLRALRGVDGLRSVDHSKSWLFTILRNAWLNQLRHRRVTPEILDLDSEESRTKEPADEAPDPYSIYVAQGEHKQVQAAIERLPVDLREIIMLREYEELSYKEIAEVLGCPIGTVMSRLARARSRLRQRLSWLGSSPSAEQESNAAPESIDTRRSAAARQKPAIQNLSISPLRLIREY